ncbi:hypothetical protein GMORB2_6390 [Geosmithia morbida]|uniref:Uncharacterized protein n=1 Tax=Geosmithia morbida TaxID=1094350 RepID=A0A9P4YZ50_9HYPO|nr:uncharacterized protein GMORB2_6390 [Geosmithia morbida]KAF4123689.1 hypothetical protein GMORB2_6390 [Geosmithia morbida]
MAEAAQAEASVAISPTECPLQHQRHHRSI